MSDSYEQVRQRIIERIPQDDDIREGSPIAIAIDPVARELADNTLKFVEDSKKQAHPLTADREHLITEADPYGLKPMPATPAQGEGKFNIPVAIGDRFTISGVIFRVTEASPTVEEGLFFYYLECETPGDTGNISPGKLIPVTLHQGLTVSELVRITINGENEEDTESFRERFRSLFNAKSYGGNVANYYEWLAGIQGVGRAKILACENPEGEIKDTYVTVVISDSNNEKPTPELIELTQEALNPREMTGKGVGLAPITADVYVTGVKEREINLKFTVESEVSKKVEIEKALEDYIKTQNLEWGNITCQESAYNPKGLCNVHIRIAQLMSAILDVEGVIDVTELTINGESENLDLSWDEIGKLGEIDETDRTPAA